MKVPPFDECQQCISTNEKAGFRAVNQWGALILTREIRGLDFYQSVRQCQICYLCNTKGYRRLAQLALSDNANCGFCVIRQVIPELECTIGIARQCQICILCNTKGYRGLAQLALPDNAKYAICVTPRVIEDLHNWHCQTMPIVDSV